MLKVKKIFISITLLLSLSVCNCIAQNLQILDLLNTASEELASNPATRIKLENIGYNNNGITKWLINNSLQSYQFQIQLEDNRILNITLKSNESKRIFYTPKKINIKTIKEISSQKAINDPNNKNKRIFQWANNSWFSIP